MDESPLAARVRQRLRELDRDQKWLAKKLGKSPSTVSRWMDGSREMTVRDLRELGLVLHRTTGWLLGETEASEDLPELVSAS